MSTEPIPPVTGTPEGHLLQDMDRKFSRWLESKPDAMRRAREAVEAIRAAEGQADTGSER